MRPRPVRRLAALALAGAAAAVLVGCTTPPPITPPVSVRPSAGSSAAASSGQSPTAPSGESTQVPAPPSSERQAPPRPTAPPATTAGSLTAADLPTELPSGFKAAVRAPAEEERVPNGSWVFEAPAEQAAWEAVARCPANDSRDWPTARFALGGTYQNANGRPGNALVVEFADEAAAQTYAANYRAVLGSCPRTNALPSATSVATGDAWYVGRRSYATERWSELVAQRGNRVWLAIWNDDATSSSADMSAIATQLAGG